MIARCNKLLYVHIYIQIKKEAFKITNLVRWYEIVSAFHCTVSALHLYACYLCVGKNTRILFIYRQFLFYFYSDILRKQLLLSWLQMVLCQTSFCLVSLINFLTKLLHYLKIYHILNEREMVLKRSCLTI